MNKVIDIREGLRARFLHDELHETRGSYGYETEAATREAEDHEIAMLESGEWVVALCVIEERCSKCGHWAAYDSCGGIVIPPDDINLDFVLDNMEVPS